MVINLQVLDIYVSKHTGSWTNIQEDIGGKYDITITDEHKRKCKELYVQMT